MKRRNVCNVGIFGGYRKEGVKMDPAAELCPQERAALVTAMLLKKRRMTWGQLMEVTGISYAGVWKLVNKIARVLPIYYDKEAQVWEVLD